MESVARFRPLIDGKKQTAWTLMVLMLWINGCRHDFSADEAFDLVVGVAARRRVVGGQCRGDCLAPRETIATGILSAGAG